MTTPKPPSKADCAGLLARGGRAHRYITFRSDEVDVLVKAYQNAMEVMTRRHTHHCGACYEDPAIGAKKQPCEVADMLRDHHGESGGK